VHPGIVAVGWRSGRVHQWLQRGAVDLGKGSCQVFGIRKVAVTIGILIGNAEIEFASCTLGCVMLSYV
jgi:hypothetical protein